MVFVQHDFVNMLFFQVHDGGMFFFQDDFVNRHSELTLVQLVSCIVMESILEKGCIISRIDSTVASFFFQR